jgi:hypothetical protein
VALPAWCLDHVDGAEKVYSRCKAEDGEEAEERVPASLAVYLQRQVDGSGFGAWGLGIEIFQSTRRLVTLLIAFNFVGPKP